MKGIHVIIALILIIGMGYYLYVASTAKRGRKRIVDLLVVGLMLSLSPTLSKVIRINTVEMAGLLIFVYGWGLLIVEKFREGLNESSPEK